MSHFERKSGRMFKHMAPGNPEFRLQPNMPSVLYVPEYGINVAIVPRAASTAMRKALHHRCHLTETPEAPTYVWIRDPLDRLASAFHLLSVDGDYEPVVDRIIAGTRDVHLLPVTDLYTNFDLINTLPFEELDESWTELMPDIPLEPVRVSRNRATWDEIKAKIPVAKANMVEAKFNADKVVHANAKAKRKAAKEAKAVAKGK